MGRAPETETTHASVFPLPTRPKREKAIRSRLIPFFFLSLSSIPTIIMPAKKKGGRRSEPKLFRCTGFGDCNMVFTRSEHLARHARKHTGEVGFALDSL